MRVARWEGRPVADVLQQPYALTLWTFLEIEDVERIEHLLSRDDLFTVAMLTAAAVLDGKAYDRLRGRYVESLKRDPDDEVGSLDEHAEHLRLLDEWARQNAEKFPLTVS